MAQNVAARCGLTIVEGTPQADLLYRLGREIRLDQTVCSLFHTLRREGNKATHQFRTQHREDFNVPGPISTIRTAEAILARIKAERKKAEPKKKPRKRTTQASSK